ncbi:hypothetical protein OROHE_025536 [Orobanche hederae]
MASSIYAPKKVHFYFSLCVLSSFFTFVEQAKASHVYSYKHGFRGFAAKLIEEQAARVAEILGVVSVFPNTKRSLHSTHSWDFMGLVGKDNMEEIAGYSTKNQVNVIFGFIDTGENSNSVNSNATSKILSAKTVLGSQATSRVAPFSPKGPNASTPEILKVYSFNM